MTTKQREKAVDCIKRGFSTISRCSWFLLLLTFISAITLVGCSPAQFKTKAAQVTQLVFTAPSGPQTFNLTQNHSAYSVFGYIYDGLVTENGLTGEVEPALAESWEISPDKKRIVFTLREGLKWSDGEPLTIDDVLFSYRDIYFNEKIPTDIRDGLRIGTNRALPTVKKTRSAPDRICCNRTLCPLFEIRRRAVNPASPCSTGVCPNHWYCW